MRRRHAGSGRSSAMSKSCAAVSGGEHEEHQDDFVLDVLYQDARRVGSFLSQFDESGFLERVIQRESVSKGGGARFQVRRWSRRLIGRYWWQWQRITRARSASGWV